MMVKNIEVSQFLQLGWWPPENSQKKMFCSREKHKLIKPFLMYKAIF
jgi:hypothetical protein